MRILVLGARGSVGSHIVDEARTRGHDVTAATRETVDATDPDSLARAAAGHDVVVGAVIDRSAPATLVRVAQALLAADVPRVIVVGGAGTLEANAGLVVMDLPDFNADYRAEAQAHLDALHRLQASETRVDWTVITPPRTFDDSGRTGSYRTADDALLLDDDGRSRISLEDFAVAVLDEVERPAHRRQRFTVAY